MTEYTRTIGLDVGDRVTHMHGLDELGSTFSVDKFSTTRDVLSALFGSMDPSRVVMETGTHSNWMARTLDDLGHDVLVADARRLTMISASKKKSDKNDAALLAEMGQKAPSLLHLTKPRSLDDSRGQALIRARAALVKARTQLIVTVRGLLKTLEGLRIPACDADNFHKKCAELPSHLRYLLDLLVPAIEALTKAIHRADQAIAKMLETFQEARYLTQMFGVAATTAIAFMTTIGSPDRFPNPRNVPVFLGLAPASDSSGTITKQLGIMKTGDSTTRRLLVSAAYKIIFQGPDSDLQRFGLRLAERGGRAAKKRAATAVARKLAVLLFVLWRDKAEWVPLKNAPTYGPELPPTEPDPSPQLAPSAG